MSTMTQVAVAHRSLDLCVEIIQITSIEFVAMKAYEGVANSKAWPTAMVMVLQFCVQAEPVRTKGELRATSFTRVAHAGGLLHCAICCHYIGAFSFNNLSIGMILACVTLIFDNYASNCKLILSKT